MQKKSSRNKNIAFLTRPIGPPWDESSKNFALYLSKAMKIPNTNFILLSTSHTIPKLPFNIKQLPLHQKDELNLWTKLRFFVYLLVSPPDCIHSLTVLTPFTGAIIKLLKLVKNFKAIQTITSLSNDRSLALKLSIFGDVVVSLSENTAQKLRRIGINAIVIPPGIPTDNFKPAKKEKIIAFLGELYRLKSYNIVVDLVEILERSLPDYNIVLGFRTKNKPAEEKQLVAKLRKRFENSQSITFVEVIEDMPRFLERTKLVIFPATRIVGKFDYPLVLLEALTSGTPIVISRLGPLEELSSLAGVMTAPSNSADSFFKTIKNALNDYKNLSKAARKTAENNFNIQEIAKQYETLYKNLLF